MNREIKYRVWDKLLRDMHYIDLCDLADGDDYWYDGETSVWEVMNDSTSEQRRYVIQQYTGLKDKNGKEVYEGDIFHLGDPNITYAVVYFDTAFRGKQKVSSSYVGLEEWKDCIEVIGNIYESEVNDEKI